MTQKKVLLAEDDRFLIDIYTTKLKEAGISVDVAINGEECLDKLKKRKISPFNSRYCFTGN